MGFPGEGMKIFYRNSLNDVIKYFAKYHKGKVKIFNLCDDESIDTSKISIKLDKSLMKTYKLNVQKISISYFPMMDHNPAPLKMLFFFCLDALLYLLQDPENVIAVHCKAGKGRTGLAISCYYLFMEGCQDAYEAINLFNKRRTTDMQGLKIPS
jgi:phosphatidylinositol-3,4,5-trisphosphate 3-phosphatase/dual-specificity protein phosphatase PTEN